ncbi:MAG: murein biosynthesis integral membrane protein MurJ [Chlamydiae bacterium]|nr:murein biosynthesis integral membrane protein MurJ [Chlamydiota bacterium]
MIRQAVHFFLGTLISRLGGLLRELSMSACFGASALVGDFFISYRWSNIFRRLLGEGGVSNGFIPMFERYRQEDPYKADLFFRDLFWSLAILLVPTLFLLSLIFFGHIASFMMPGVIFIVFYALFMAFLQCHNHFFLPSVAPTIFNLIWVGGCFLFKSEEQSYALKGIALCISVAFFFQWVVLLPKTAKCLKIGLSDWFQIRPFSAEVKQLLKPLLLTLVGVAATQLNGAIDLLFAKWADPKGAAFLSYAIKLEQVPMALFGVAVSQAIAPLLARAYQGKNFAKYNHLTEKSLRITLKLLAPFTLLFFVAAPPFVSLIYGRGAFLDADVTHTAQALAFYSIGLVPAGLILLLAPSFYAAQDFRTPMKATFMAVGMNTFLNFLLVFVFSAGSWAIALTTSLSFWAQWAYLAWKLQAPYPLKSLVKHLLLVCLITLISFYLFPDLYWSTSYPTTILDKGWQLLNIAAVPFFLYTLGAFCLKDSAIVEKGGNIVDEKNLKLDADA